MTTETRLTAKEAAEKAVKYRNLKEVEAQLKAELEPLNKALRKHIEETGEPICVEGQPDLVLEPRSTGTVWDAEGYARKHPEDFARALEKGGVTLNGKILDDLYAAGLITGTYKESGTSGQTWALKFKGK